MTRLTGMTTIVLRPPAVWDLDRAKRHGWLQRTLEQQGRGARVLPVGLH